MTTPLGEIQKPEAERFKKGRKLYLVPLFHAPADAPQDLQELLDRYWSGVREHIGRLEAGLGPVNRIYHETVFLPGEEGGKLVEQFNPLGYPLIKARCQGGAELEITEDQALVEESFDWQRCLSLGLVSQKGHSTVFQAYMRVTNQRYQYIASRINDTLKEDESAILVIDDGHRVQFPSDIQVFYIAPPALNELRRWINDWLSASARSGESGEPAHRGADPPPEAEDSSSPAQGEEEASTPQ